MYQLRWHSKQYISKPVNLIHGITDKKYKKCWKGHFLRYDGVKLNRWNALFRYQCWSNISLDMRTCILLVCIKAIYLYLNKTGTCVEKEFTFTLYVCISKKQEKKVVSIVMAGVRNERLNVRDMPNQMSGFDNSRIFLLSLSDISQVVITSVCYCET